MHGEIDIRCSGRGGGSGPLLFTCINIGSMQNSDIYICTSM